MTYPEIVTILSISFIISFIMVPYKHLPIAIGIILALLTVAQLAFHVDDDADDTSPTSQEQAQ